MPFAHGRQASELLACNVQVMPDADGAAQPLQDGSCNTQDAFSATGQPQMQTAHAATESKQQPVGQSHGPRQLLSRSSAPAGSQAAAAAARAALLPDGFQQRMYVLPGQSVANLPECGQVWALCCVASASKIWCYCMKLATPNWMACDTAGCIGTVRGAGFQAKLS